MLYTNAQSTGNKQEDLEAIVLLESYNFVLWDIHGNPITRVQLLMAMGYEEGRGEKGEVEG